MLIVIYKRNSDAKINRLILLLKLYLFDEFGNKNLLRRKIKNIVLYKKRIMS